MAWRLHQQLTRGEFDFTVRGRISGMLWLAGIDQPVCVELEGTPARDLAGHKLVVVNPQPMGKVPDGLSRIHRGVPGEMTASRKVRLLDEDIAGASGDQNGGKLFAWHWGNAVYLEWFSESSGRMVIESACYDVTIEHVGSWQLEPEDEACQQDATRAAMMSFLARPTPQSAGEFADWLPAEDEPPACAREAEADAEDARMSRVTDRVARRLRELPDESADDFMRIYEEEREKLRKELGEPEPEALTPEQEKERNEWIDEMNRAAEEALQEMEQDPEFFAPHKNHPLVERCHELCRNARSELLRLGLISEIDSEEHPLQEWIFALQCASAKLAGALNPAVEDGDWPPSPVFAGSVLVRLKKARAYLRDALMALRSAAEDDLAPRLWLEFASTTTSSLLASLQERIDEVRDVLQDDVAEE